MPMLDDISDRSDDETYASSSSSEREELQSGFYRITTVNGVPLGRGKLSEYDPSLVVTLPRHTPAPKVCHLHPNILASSHVTQWYIQKRQSGRYVVAIDNLPIYFEQMALRIKRENEEDRGIEWSIEPCDEHSGLYK